MVGAHSPPCFFIQKKTQKGIKNAFLFHKQAKK